MLVVVVAIAALALWAFVFLPPDDQLWRRTVVAAGVMIVGCSAILVAGDRFGAVVGPFTPAEVAIGLGIGGAWLAATHLGHRVLCRLFPSFIRQVSDLYRKGTGDSTALMVGAVTAMAVAEELLFRGIVQERAGLVVGVAVYAGVQAVERKWVLVLAAALCGTATPQSMT